MGQPWGRLYTGTRHHRKIRILRQRCPDSWWIFYPLLEMAFETDNDGLIYIDPDIPYSPEELAGEVGARVDVMEDTLSVMADLRLIARDNGFVQFLSYRDRQFKSDTSTDRVKAHREKKKREGNAEDDPMKREGNVSGPLHETGPQQPGSVSVTPPDTDTDTDTDTETEAEAEKDITQSPPPPIGGSGAASPLEPSIPPYFACKHFEISDEYFRELVKDYPGFSNKLLVMELKKMRDWLDDNPNRHKRTAKGFLKNPKSFIRNWLGKAVVHGSPRPRGSPNDRTQRNVEVCKRFLGEEIGEENG
jgi:hypothetical protein